VEFNENGDAKGRYTIYQFQRLNATNAYKYVPIGSWTERFDSELANLGKTTSKYMLIGK